MNHSLVLSTLLAALTVPALLSPHAFAQGAKKKGKAAANPEGQPLRRALADSVKVEGGPHAFWNGAQFDETMKLALKFFRESLAGTPGRK